MHWRNWNRCILQTGLKNLFASFSLITFKSGNSFFIPLRMAQESACFRRTLNWSKQSCLLDGKRKPYTFVHICLHSSTTVWISVSNMRGMWGVCVMFLVIPEISWVALVSGIQKMFTTCFRKMAHSTVRNRPIEIHNILGAWSNKKIRRTFFETKDHKASRQKKLVQQQNWNGIDRKAS